MQTPAFITDRIERLETDDRLDPIGRALGRVAERTADSPVGPALRGEWLGHALHPLLTHLPLGSWLAAGMLDVMGGRDSRPAAQRLVGLGLAFVPATAAAGLVDYSSDDRPEVRRVGAAHAAGNVVVAGLYFLSWRSRVQGDHVRGVVWGLGGGALAWVTGYLGGHLSLARDVGSGFRGFPSHTRSSETGAPDPGSSPGGAGVRHPQPEELITVEEAAELLTVPQAQIEAMVDEGLLTPAEIVGPGGTMMFPRADVVAVRMLGG